MKTSNQSETNILLPSKKIAIIYSDVHREYFPTEDQYITKKDAADDAMVIGKFVEAQGYSVCYHPGNSQLPAWLRKQKPHLVINLVDSVKGVESLASSIPGVLELLEIPYTGADVLGMSLDTNKFVIKKLLQQHGLPVPNFQLFSTPKDYRDPELRFPLISKLNAIHGSVEITDDAVSENEKHLRKRLRYLIETYRQPVLVEEFISGREITAIVLQEKKKSVCQAEKIFKDTNRKYVYLTFEEQWLTDINAAFNYVKYEDPLLREYVKKAFNVTKMGGYAKFDIRLDQSGRYFFIDTNCNPALGPKELDVALGVIMDLHGTEFGEIMQRLVTSAFREASRRKKLLNARVNGTIQNGIVDEPQPSDANSSL